MKGIAVITAFIIGVILGAGLGFYLASNQITSITNQSITAPVKRESLLQYCFSPGGDCKSYILYWIERANSSIHVLIYSFTLDDIGNALIQAKNRGVDVKVVMEEDNANSIGSEYYHLRNAGIDIRHDTRSALMHDKVAIIDNHIIITGSFNWTASANNSNNENLVVIDSSSWASAFELAFHDIYLSSIP